MSDRSTGGRVLVHLNSLELGGTQINAVDLAAAVRGHGYESVLIGARDTVPSRGPTLLDVAEGRDLPIELYDAASSMIRRGHQLSALADRHGVDLVHVYGAWGGDARPVYWGPARFGRRPWVQTVYEMDVAPVVKRHMPLIVGTGYLVDDLRDRPGPTTLISPPVDIERDRPSSDLATSFRVSHGLEGPLVVIVSRLHSIMKSTPIEIAIESMRELGDHATLVIVGSGDNTAALRARGAEVNESIGREAVRFLGAMSDPRPAYAAADIMLGMGSSGARSLAFGKPLVVQGEAGWCRTFDENIAASLARSSYWSPERVVDGRERLTSAIRLLLADDRLRDKLGAYGREFAIGRFGLPAMADQLAAFYRVARERYGPRLWAADLNLEATMLSAKLRRFTRGRRAVHPADNPSAESEEADRDRAAT